MKAVIYARYSSKAQNDLSIEGQIKECMKYAEQQGLTVVDEYIDRARSGSSIKQRYAFQKMIADSKEGKFDYVIVWKLDRFSRDVATGLNAENELKKNNVYVLSAVEHIDNSPSGRLSKTINMAFAQFQNENHAIFVQQGQTTNTEYCFFNGGQIPFGYKSVNVSVDFYTRRPKKKLVIDTEKEMYVKEIFQRYADGETISEIYQSLNARGITSSSGAEFSRSSFNRILKNKIYIGTYVYKDVEKPNALPRIISDELFNRVQNKLTDNKDSAGHTTAREEYLLYGKLYCGHCKSKMTGTSGKSHTKDTHRYYSCTGKKEHNCNKTNVRKDVIEDAIVNKAKSLLTDDAIVKIAKAVVDRNKELNNTAQYNYLLRQKKKIESEKNNLVTSLRSVGDNEEIRKLVFADLNKLITQEQMLEQQIYIEEKHQIKIELPEVLFFLDTLRKQKSYNLTYKRFIIKNFVNRVYLYDDNRVDVFFNFQEKSEWLTIEEIEEVTESGSTTNSLGAPNKIDTQ